MKTVYVTHLGVGCIVASFPIEELKKITTDGSYYRLYDNEQQIFSYDKKVFSVTIAEKLPEDCNVVFQL